MSASSAQTGPSHFASETVPDPIRIELMIGIFSVVAIILFGLMWPTWTVDWHTYRKTTLMRNGNPQAAIPHLLWLYNRNPNHDGDPLQDTTKNPTYLSELGQCYLNTKQYDLAEKYYRLAQENAHNLPPDDQGNPREAADFIIPIGCVQAAAGKTDEAEKTLLEALKKYKTDKLANFTLGEIEMKHGNYLQAANYFKVVARDPDYQAKVKQYYAEIEKKLFGNVG